MKKAILSSKLESVFKKMRSIFGDEKEEKSTIGVDVSEWRIKKEGVEGYINVKKNYLFYFILFLDI